MIHLTLTVLHMLLLDKDDGKSPYYSVIARYIHIHNYVVAICIHYLRYTIAIYCNTRIIKNLKFKW